MNENLEQFKMKWWGWGSKNQKFDLHHREGLKKYLSKILDIDLSQKPPHFDIAKIEIPACRIPRAILENFAAVVGKDHCTVDNEERVIHSFGKSYKDLVRVRSLNISDPIDVVLYPNSEVQISKIILLAQRNKVALIPFGGGTSVVSGVEALKGNNLFAATIDLRRLNQVKNFDPFSRLVTVEAGIFGPNLEQFLNTKGFTLGHFPQSFEFSTVGGWVATRSAGQNSVKYGEITSMVSSLTILTPDCQIKTFDAPVKSIGPESKDLFIGSEGIYGIITQVTLRVSKLPEEKLYYALLFRNFKDATQAAMDIVQAKIPVAMIRVSDERETEALQAVSSNPPKSQVASSLKSLKNKITSIIGKIKGFETGSVSLMLIGFEGSPTENNQNQQKLEDCIRRIPSIYLGEAIGDKWLKDRFFLPYLRDELMDLKVLIDTLETSTTWTNLSNVYNSTMESLKKSCAHSGVPHIAYCHISHLYPDGASLYFTVMAKGTNQLLEQWQHLKIAANEAILKAGGAISHHHGIGVDHRDHNNLSTKEIEILSGIKKKLDPYEIMNPEKLIPKI